MATLTIRIPDVHRDRLAAMAKQRGVSMNKLMEELSVPGVDRARHRDAFPIASCPRESRARTGSARQTGSHAFATQRHSEARRSCARLVVGLNPRTAARTLKVSAAASIARISYFSGFLRGDHRG